MARDHFIPASFIARFSENPAPQARKSEVHVKFRGKNFSVKKRAETIGYANSLYDIDKDFTSTQQTNAVDSVWTSYESTLNSAIDDLIAGTLSAVDFVAIIVPFVAGFFARDVSYGSRTTSRIEHAHADLPIFVKESMSEPNHVALNRLSELDFITPKLLASKWVVSETDDDLILTDFGLGFNYVGIFENVDATSYLLPLGPRSLLEITPMPVLPLFEIGDRGLSPIIVHSNEIRPASKVNELLKMTSIRYCMGTKSAIDSISLPADREMTDHDVDICMMYWPFQPSLSKMKGLYPVVGALATGEIGIGDLSEVLLDRHYWLRKVDPGAKIISVPSRTVAALFLYEQNDRLYVRPHLGRISKTSNQTIHLGPFNAEVDDLA